jgi:hypothetical protein
MTTYLCLKLQSYFFLPYSIQGLRGRHIPLLLTAYQRLQTADKEQYLELREHQYTIHQANRKTPIFP